MDPLNYEQTAYDSTRPRELKPAKPMEQRGFITRQMLKQKLELQPVACCEYLVLSDFDNLRYAKDNQNREHISTPPLQMGWMGFANPMLWAMIARFSAGFFGFGLLFSGFVGIPLAMLMFAPHEYIRARILEGVEVCGGAGGFLLIPYFILRYLLNNNKFTNKNNTVFDRSTGMVRMPLKNGKVWQVRFDELEPYLHETISPNGVVYYHLLFVHRYSDSYMTSPTRHMDAWAVNLDWEYYQQYMDISKPLPDVPVFEPDRALDPTSIAWDEKTGRPQGFWAKTPNDAFKQLMQESWSAAKTYPWGSTRKQAKAAGWKPSRYGEQTYWDRETQKEKDKKHKHQHGHGEAPAPGAAPA